MVVARTFTHVAPAAIDAFWRKLGCALQTLFENEMKLENWP